MKDLSTIKETVGGYKLLTPIIKMKYGYLPLFALVETVEDTQAVKVMWDINGKTFKIDNKSNEDRRFDINIKSEYDELIEKLKTVTQLKNGCKIIPETIVVLPEEFWEECNYVISAFVIEGNGDINNYTFTENGNYSYSGECSSDILFNS